MTTATKPTQVARPWRATIRTIAQAVIGGIFTLIAAVQSLQAFAPQLLEQLGKFLPEGWIIWLSGAIAFAGVVAGAVARIMAIPQVNALLTRFHLGALPKK